jgi:hypothetical protein
VRRLPSGQTKVGCCTADVFCRTNQRVTGLSKQNHDEHPISAEALRRRRPRLHAHACFIRIHDRAQTSRHSRRISQQESSMVPAAPRSHYNPAEPRIPRGEPGGGRWTYGSESVQPAFLDPISMAGAAAIVQGALLFLTWLALRSGPDRQAYIILGRQFDRTSRGTIDLEDAGSTTIEKVNKFCDDGLEKVNKLIQKALDETDRKDYDTPSKYGIAVHKKLANLIKKDLPTDKWEAEISFDEAGFATYGEFGTVRIDILQMLTEKRALCIYDLKTGRSKLSKKRQKQLADRVFNAINEGVEHVLVTDVHPPAPNR